MQLDEGFWMRWSDNFGRTFDGGRVVIPVRKKIFRREKRRTLCVLPMVWSDRPPYTKLSDSFTKTKRYFLSPFFIKAR